MNHIATHDRIVQEYFRGLAGAHTAGYTLKTRSGYVYLRRQALVSDILRRLPGGYLLDAGCGTAVMAPVARKCGFAYTGIDHSREMIAQAKMDDPGPGAYAVSRIEELPLASDRFDVVLALGVLEYVERGDLPVAVSELARVLKPGGTLVVSLLNCASPMWRLRSLRERLQCLRARAARRPCGPAAPELTFSVRQERSLLQGAGLIHCRSVMYAFCVVPGRLYAWKPKPSAALSAWMEQLDGTPLNFLALGRLTVATRPA